MRYILLVGVALNFIGAVKFLVTSLRVDPSASDVSNEYLMFKLFTAGTAAVFGMLYLYLFLHPEYVVPFLVFGAALKTWALLLSIFLYFRKQLSLKSLTDFGVTNGVVGALLWFYIFSY